MMIGRKECHCPDESSPSESSPSESSSSSESSSESESLSGSSPPVLVNLCCDAVPATWNITTEGLENPLSCSSVDFNGTFTLSSDPPTVLVNTFAQGGLIETVQIWHSLATGLAYKRDLFDIFQFSCLAHNQFNPGDIQEYHLWNLRLIHNHATGLCAYVLDSSGYNATATSGRFGTFARHVFVTSLLDRWVPGQNNCLAGPFSLARDVPPAAFTLVPA